MRTSAYYRLAVNFAIMTVLIIAGTINAQEPGSANPAELKSVSLNSGNTGEWTLYFGPQETTAPNTPEELKKSNRESIKANVPGNVELDLLNAGKIKDPMVGSNIDYLRKYETYQWWYHRTFKKPDIPKEHRVELCFDGIDCVADIWLNNVKIGHTENMLVEHRFDVTDLIGEDNELYVCISSPVLEGRKFQREAFGGRADALAEAVNVRKAAHMYGWDILPRLVSAGLWRDVRLELIPPTHFKAVYWVTKSVDVEKKTASMYVDWEFATDRLNIDDLVLRVTLKRGEKVSYDESIKLYTTVSRKHIWNLQDIDFWWPRGYGQPALYDATLQIIDHDGSVIAENRQKIGIRTAELVRTDISTKESPGEFVFKINYEKIFVKGTNWVALDALHSRDRQHVKKSVDMLVDLNCNMIRMWGGNVYECDEFYNLCDENGIMVWQDFSMACTIYPQDDQFAKKVEQEAAKVIYRLRHHPSLVLWAGNNENDQSLEGDHSLIDPNLDVISRKVLPSMLLRLDPKTPYLPSSPYISPAAFKLEGKVNQYHIPEQHLWGPRGYFKAPFYSENVAIFVSEIGYHGCPNRPSLEKMMEKDFVYPWTDNFKWNDQWQTKAVRTHPYSTVTAERNNLMINQIKCVFTSVPTDLDMFIQTSQIIQAEAMKYFIEFFRMRKFERSGILWWNLRDGWPVISDAIVDYYYSKKLAYQYIKRVQTDVCVMIGDANDQGHPVVVVNDTRDEVAGMMTIKDADTQKMLLSKSFNVGKNGKSIEGYLPETTDTKLWLIEWEVGGKKYLNHYLAFKPRFDAETYMKWLPILKSNR
jgi:beta-mannosidase